MYVHPITGEAVFSVTTIIKNGIPKPGLPQWYANEAALYAVNNWTSLSEIYSTEYRYDEIRNAPSRVRDQKADRGDQVHEEVENYTGDIKDNPFLTQWDSFLATSQFQIVEREVTLWNRIHGYAGTADWLAVDPNGEYILGDTKTGNRIYPDHAIQVEALSRCGVILREDGSEEKLDCVISGILHLRPKSWWWYHFDSPRLQANNWKTFLAAKVVSDWRACHSDMVLGKKKWNKDNWGE